MVRPEDIPAGARVRIMGGPAAHQVVVQYQDQPVVGIRAINLLVEAGGTCQATLLYRSLDPDVEGPCLREVEPDVDLQVYARGLCGAAA